MRSILPLATALVIAGSSLASPQGPTNGRAVMERVDARARTASQYSEGMITVEEKGKTKTKAWRSWRLGWGAEAKGLIQFLEPAEVRGVGLLTLSHAGKPAEQWFYAPAIDRDRRIAKQEKSTRFLGTHFTYEDMEERQLDAYDYTLDGEETIEGAPCYKVTAKPKPEEESQYAKLDFWVLQDRFVTIQVHGYVGDELRRIFHGSDVSDDDGVPLVHRWVLSDTKRLGTTTLVLGHIRLNVPVDSGLFTAGAMRTLHEPPK
jgi:Outer membrane lipoprotein-sorting protein